MNILFTADIHANKKRLSDVITFLDFCKKTIINEKIDLFVIGGDLWNAMVPNTKGSGFVDIMNSLKGISELTDLRIIYGTPSHEPEGSLDFISNLNTSNKHSVKVFRQAETELINGINMLFIPEPRRSDFISDSPKKTSELINKYLSNICSKGADIIFYHGEIDGAVMDNGMSCKSDYRLSKSMINNSGAKLVLAGHIHTPQTPMENVYYTGSPIPCNFGEKHEGSVIVFSYNNKVENLHRIKTNAPTYKTIELEQLDDLEKIYNFNFKNNHIKLSIPMKSSEKLSFNMNKVSNEIKEKTNATSVHIKVFVNNDVSVRSKEIAKATTLEDKLKIYSKVNELKLTPSILQKAHEMEDSLLINYTFPSHSFELISLDLKGAKGIKNHEQIFIDFSKFEPGVVALIGNNGSGKTTLLEMASPFPCLLTRSGSLRSHFYLKDSHKIVVFKDENGKYYKFIIQLAAHVDNGLVKYFAETSDDGENWKSVKECTGNLTDYQNYVESLFGNISLYLRTAFFTKGNTKGTPDIASATKGERISLLSQLLGTENLNTLHSITNDKLKDIKSKIDKISGIEAEYDNILFQKSEDESKLKIIKKDLNSVNSELDKIQAKIPDIQKKADIFNEKYKNNNTPEALKKECESKINTLQYHLDDLKNHKEKNDFFKIHKTQIKEYKESYDLYINAEKELKKLSDSLNKLTKNYYDIKSDYDNAVNNSYNENQKIVNTTAKVKTLKESLPEISDYCPTCGYKLTASKKKELYLSQEKIRDEIDAIEDFIKQQKTIVKNCRQKETSLNTRMKKAKEELDNAKEKYDEADGKSIATSTYLEINSVYKDYVSYIEVSNLETDIEKVSEELKKENELLTSINSEEYINYNEELDKLIKSKDFNDNMKLKLSMDLASAETTIKLENEKLDKLKDDKLLAKTLSSEYDDYSFLEKAFSNSGIQALELESAAPSIADLTNQILRESYGDKFTVSFSTLKQGRNKVIDDFAINVTNNESGWTTPIELLSEGEKIWIIQSLYYAFSLIRMEKTGFSFKVRFVDESDGALDSEMRLKYVSMIESAHKAGNARLTVMITHSQEVKDIVGQTISL